MFTGIRALKNKQHRIEILIRGHLIKQFPFYPVPNYVLVRGHAISLITTSKELAALTGGAEKIKKVKIKKIEKNLIFTFLFYPFEFLKAILFLKTKGP